MSRLSASWPTFIRPSLRTYERGKSRDDANVHATTSDLTLKIASFSKDTESTHSHRGDKSQRDTLGIFGGVFFFFSFFSEKVGRRKTSRTPSNTSCGDSVFSGTKRRKAPWNF